MTFFKSNFIKILEKCTSNLLLEPDWDGMLQLCDLIRGNDIKPRDAVAAIKKTLEIQNPHQQYFGYCVLDTGRIVYIYLLISFEVQSRKQNPNQNSCMDDNPAFCIFFPGLNVKALPINK